MKRDLLRAFFCALAVGAVWWSPAQAHGDKGFIFTTTFDGRGGGRQYDSKCAVYLGAGPASHGRSKPKGLPEGDYYFQVTDPGGKKLLSTDAISNRRVTISNGVIVSHAGTHPTGLNQAHWKFRAMSVGLAGPNCPSDFLDTPNHRGVYKVWLTPVEEYRGNPARCRKRCFHGFMAAESKTSVFRVENTTPPPAGACLTITKELSPSEGAEFVAAEGWAITVADPLGTENSFETNGNGEVQVCDLVDGRYVISEERRPNTLVVGLVVNGLELLPDSVYSFTWDSSRASMSIVFQNQAF